MWNGLENAAAVAQVVGLDVGGLITRIGQAARTARQNSKDCEHLARRVGTLAELVPWLQDAEARRLMAGLDLRGTLLEAHALVASCQSRGIASQLFSASRQAERFRDVERKIDTFLAIVPLVSYLAITRRLDGNNGAGTNHTGRSQSQLLKDQSGGGGDAADLESFTLAEIAVATENFAVVLSKDAETGTTVYKGKLYNGTEVAVKRLNPSRPGGGAEDAFFAEQHILSPLRHDNIVRLLGTCADDGERMLITQFMPNGSLHDHLHGRLSSSSPVATSWKTRVHVLLDVARGVEHLHRYAVPLVIHGNVASSNVLLDASWAPRLSGFGAAVWRAAGKDSQAVDVAGGGTAALYGGYTDPEYYSTGCVRSASDVYGFGVVMLEVLTGQTPVVSVWDDMKQSVVTMTLPAFALPSVHAGRLGDVLDRHPAPWPTTWQQLQPLQLVADIAARCLCLPGDNRPAISDVVAHLEQALQLLYE